METKMDKAEVRAWMDRWKAVNEAHREELRTTPMETKLRQLAVMMHTARTLGWKTSTEAELRRIRARWARLKRGRDAG
jgi:hypothetical protein